MRWQAPTTARSNDPEAREQQLQNAQVLLLAKYSGGRTCLDLVRAMHAVRAAADGYGADGEKQAEVPADDVLAALTQLEEARAALDTLERAHVAQPGLAVVDVAACDEQTAFAVQELLAGR